MVFASAKAIADYRVYIKANKLNFILFNPMTLKKLSDFEPNYLQTFEGNDIIGFKVYIDSSDEKVGSVKDILVDESGHFRYLVVDFGLWIFNKTIILPVGRSRVDYEAQRIYVLGLNRKQAENLPEYNDSVLVNYEYEKQVRGVYRTPANDFLAAEEIELAESNTIASKQDNYNYQQDSSLYDLNDTNHQTLKLYQDRLLAKKNRAINLGETEITQQIQPRKKPTRSACLIFNPVAGQSDADLDLATIQRILEPEFNLDIRITTPEVDADQLAQEAVKRGVELLIVSGGDGTCLRRRRLLWELVFR
jgi:hypothetical protein